MESEATFSFPEATIWLVSNSQCAQQRKRLKNKAITFKRNCELSSELGYVTDVKADAKANVKWVVWCEFPRLSERRIKLYPDNSNPRSQIRRYFEAKLISLWFASYIYCNINLYNTKPRWLEGIFTSVQVLFFVILLEAGFVLFYRFYATTLLEIIHWNMYKTILYPSVSGLFGQNPTRIRLLKHV